MGRAASHLGLCSLGSASGPTPGGILSWVRSAVPGENPEPVSVTAVRLKTAAVDLLHVAVKNLIFGNTML